MATIQVRNVPDDVHRTYQVRAAAAGMSVQEYLLAELTRNARLRTPAELVAEVDSRMASKGATGSLESGRPISSVPTANRTEHREDGVRRVGVRRCLGGRRRCWRRCEI